MSGLPDWFDEEVVDMVKIWHEAEATRERARADILHQFVGLFRLDNRNPDDYRKEIETQLDKELDRVYRSQQVENTDTQR